MPYTPYHFGPASWIGLIFFKFLDFPTLLVSSVIIDIEPFCVFVFNAPWPVHGFLHTFLGGSIVAVITAVIMFYLKKPIQKIMTDLKLPQDSSFLKILFTSLFGVYSHIVLDSFLYFDIKPLYPFSNKNPFLGILSHNGVYTFCKVSFVVGGVLYFVRIYPYLKEEIFKK